MILRNMWQVLLQEKEQQGSSPIGFGLLQRKYQIGREKVCCFVRFALLIALLIFFSICLTETTPVPHWVAAFYTERSVLLWWHAATNRFNTPHIALLRLHAFSTSTSHLISMHAVSVSHSFKQFANERRRRLQVMTCTHRPALHHFPS